MKYNQACLRFKSNDGSPDQYKILSFVATFGHPINADNTPMERADNLWYLWSEEKGYYVWE